ncbi:plasmid partitioning protein RepB [Pararhizobium haloflavum]|uniref:plasmid partitioning protein RepB n=1 Tax=Pararhizobium haloflavum TaxID=2037914 RepID=UPI000C1A0656|nr:plasmid partitioning protein RepB [Pararhizobium haloflavum]
MTAADRNKKMRAMFGGLDPQTLAQQASDDVVPRPTPNPAPAEKRVSSGAVRSMQGAFSAIESENDKLRQQLLDTEQVVDIDPGEIDPSFVSDRIAVDNDPEFDAFVESINQSGQQVAILVRPSPTTPGRYQVAYGHRRLKAAKRLGRPVKAIVRSLSDDELVVAQGKENSERANLSFIEQALFALTLKEKKFQRATIAASLGRGDEKGLAYISILTGLAAALPQELVRAIGPATNSGRPKWEALAKQIRNAAMNETQKKLFAQLAESDAWKRAASDRRLDLARRMFESRDKPSKPEATQLAPGIDWRRAKGKTHITIDEKVSPGLAQWLEGRMAEIIAQFEEERQ